MKVNNFFILSTLLFFLVACGSETPTKKVANTTTGGNNSGVSYSLTTEPSKDTEDEVEFNKTLDLLAKEEAILHSKTNLSFMKVPAIEGFDLSVYYDPYYLPVADKNFTKEEYLNLSEALSAFKKNIEAEVHETAQNTLETAPAGYLTALGKLIGCQVASSFLELYYNYPDIASDIVNFDVPRRKLEQKNYKMGIVDKRYLLHTHLKRINNGTGWDDDDVHLTDYDYTSRFKKYAIKYLPYKADHDSIIALIGKDKKAEELFNQMTTAASNIINFLTGTELPATVTMPGPFLAYFLYISQLGDSVRRSLTAQAQH